METGAAAWRGDDPPSETPIRVEPRKMSTLSEVAEEIRADLARHGLHPSDDELAEMAFEALREGDPDDARDWDEDDLDDTPWPPTDSGTEARGHHPTTRRGSQ